MAHSATASPSSAAVEKPAMARAGWKEIAVMLICVSIPCCFSFLLRQAAGKQIVMIDFGEIYFSARSALHGLDPYSPPQVLREFESAGVHFATDRTGKRGDQIVVTRNRNLPTTLLFTVPFSLLPWEPAQHLWMLLTAAVLVIAAVLTWDLGAGAAPLLWVALAGFFLAQSDLLFYSGNLAGVAVSLCIIAAWCFLKERCVWLGVVLLALSLVLKPNDSGFVWLYFLLARGALRKRALQTLAVTAVLAGCAALWIAPASPHWFHELEQNIHDSTSRGNTDDPGPNGGPAVTFETLTNLQTVFSIFKDDPSFYDPASYLAGGILILIWGLTALRRRLSLENATLALAAIAPLTLLPSYHRSNDAGLILLALPACAMLWRKKGAKRWLALALTAGGILTTASTTLGFLRDSTPALAAFAARFPGKLATAILLRPTPWIMLAMGCFFLWVYLTYLPATAPAPPEPAESQK